MANLVGMPRAAWRWQPTYPVELKIPGLYILPGINALKSGTPKYTQNMFGRCISGVSNFYEYHVLNSSFLPSTTTKGITILIAFERVHSDQYQTQVGVAGTPPSTNNVFAFRNWGGNELSPTISSPAYPVPANTPIVSLFTKKGDHYYWFINGKIWASGNVVANLTCVEGYLFWAGWRSSYNIALAGLFESLSLSQCRELSINPWQIFKPRIARFISIPSSGPVTFQPAWARSRSLILGSGV